MPSITNLVFLRRVNSRILYEQMLGRATRLCPDIGRKGFRIFDAVDLYPHLQSLTEMRPVVVNPNITLAQLFDELVRVREREQRDNIRDQIIVKMARALSKLPEEASQHYEAMAGETPQDTLKRFREGTGEDAATWVKSKPGVGPILDWRSDGGSPSAIPISQHPDEVVGVTRGYGTGQKPEDFLEGFTAFVRNNVNRMAALKVVVQRPRDLTREQLREVRLALDRQGFSEANLRNAWRDARNEGNCGLHHRLHSSGGAWRPSDAL